MATPSGKRILLVPLLSLLAAVAVIGILVFYSGGMAVIDAQNYHRIEMGMSKWRVYWLMGAPPGNYSSFKPPPLDPAVLLDPNKFESLEWASDQGRFLVSFSKETGAVTNKRQLR